MPDSFDHIDWSLTTWKGSRREQLRRWAKLDFDDILRAQEEMAELAAAFGHDPANPGDQGRDSIGERPLRRK